MAAFLVGAISGICSAMGVGGGSILLLYLTAFAGCDQLSAQGINLVFFLPTALCAIIVHLKNGYVKWRSALASAIFGVPRPSFLNFAVFLLLIGVRELFGKK